MTRTKHTPPSPSNSHSATSTPKGLVTICPDRIRPLSFVFHCRIRIWTSRDGGTWVRDHSLLTCAAHRTVCVCVCRSRFLSYVSVPTPPTKRKEGEEIEPRPEEWKRLCARCHCLRNIDCGVLQTCPRAGIGFSCAPCHTCQFSSGTPPRRQMVLIRFFFRCGDKTTPHTGRRRNPAGCC